MFASTLPLPPENVLDLWFFHSTLGWAAWRPKRQIALSIAERLRADRFRVRNLSAQWIAHRTMVRSLLARYQGVGPEALMFNTNCALCGDPLHGKPRLEGATNLSFSAAHCGGALAVAVSASGEVGIDIESVRRDFPGFASDICTPEELQLVFSPSETSSPLRVWVLKEAVAKAAGLGLALPMSEIRLVRSGGDVIQGVVGSQHYWLSNHELGQDVVGAVATSFHPRIIKQFGVDPSHVRVLG